MRRTGIANLPLHYGTAPRWLFSRMLKLSEGIVEIIVEEYGGEEFLRRISDPFWFQALSCVLGFDWHSSGSTTVTCGALKEALKDSNLGLAVAGGKGRMSRNTPQEIQQIGEGYDMPSKEIEKLVYSSKMSAKVDNAVLQDHHQLYHHAFLLTEEGGWAVVQQGLNPERGYARRYHWYHGHVKDFLNEPHEAILGERMLGTLDMTSRKSKECRETSVDLAKDNPRKIANFVKSIRHPSQRSLLYWAGNKEDTRILTMPKTINWEALKKAYDFQPRNYEELLSISGIGPSTVRALALISDLIYGKEPSWKDPVKYSFTVGGKDGVPYPVDEEVMDRCIHVLKEGIGEAKIGKEEKLGALRRLKEFLPVSL